jgi:hypothetical protein
VRLVLIGLLVPAVVQAQQQVSRGFQLDADGSLRVTVPAGSVRITAWDRDSVSITGTIAPGGGSFYGGGRGRGGKMAVDNGDMSGTGPGADLEIRVPARARLWVKTVGAEVTVEGALGEVECISVAGSIRITGQPKVLGAETMDGRVTVEGAGGVMRIRTGGGNVTVRGPGGDVTVSSVGGTIDVTADKLERGRLESVTGTVRFTGNVVPGGALETETHSADVVLRFLGDLDAEVTLVSVGGMVFNKIAPKGTAPPKGKPVVFVAGEGGAQVSARSFKGNVTISR